MKILVLLTVLIGTNSQAAEVCRLAFRTNASPTAPSTRTAFAACTDSAVTVQYDYINDVEMANAKVVKDLLGLGYLPQANGNYVK